MGTKLAETEVRKWLRGQKVATQWIEAERTRFLLQVTPGESLRIYQSLQDLVSDGRNRTEPSPLLWKMRQALDRYARQRGQRRA